MLNFRACPPPPPSVQPRCYSLVMLRRARWLILLALALIIGYVTRTYLRQSADLRRDQPKASAPLPDNISATADDWSYNIKEGDRTKVNLRARSFEQIKEPSTFLLHGLKMRIYDEIGEKYDLVESERATFDTATRAMYSEGEVHITKGLNQDGSPPSKQPLRIHTSGMTFDAASSKVWTERHAAFDFGDSFGEAVGASYDPEARELHMNSAVKLDWRGGAKGAPMHLESGHLVYRETASEIHLSPWARLTRGTLTMDAGETRIQLKGETIDVVEAVKARGADTQPARRLDFAADQLTVRFTPEIEVSKVEGDGAARLVSTSKGGVTTVTSNRVDLDFVPSPKGSLLSRALATGRSRVESDPAPRGKIEPPNRIMSSEVIELTMRANGEEIDNVKTHSPGQVEFIPVEKDGRRRRMNAERISLEYGDANMLRTFRGVQKVVTRTETPKKDGKVSVGITRSDDLLAGFDEKTGDMITLEQWNNFEYEEGDRRARSVRADLDNAKELITLTTQARIWDSSGATTADRIVLRQASGDMVATGNVSSTRAPDKKDAQGGMIGSSEPLRAQAARMTTTRRNQLIRYEEKAVMWQGATRIRGRVIVIDREKNTLRADGDVVSLMPAQDKDKKGAATTITADSLLYDDATKQALYRGNAKLEQPNLTMTSKQLRLFFREEKDSQGNAETKLDRMFADGTVEIVERMAARTRHGSGEHSEYYLDEERLVLNGGSPLVVDSARGTSRGREITWFARQDRLIVDNTGSGPAVSRIKQRQQ